jgi:hypothetical protein
MDSINTINSNILEQIVSYDSDSLDNYLSNLNTTLLEQTQLNKVLIDKKHQDNIDSVKAFISRNKNQIDYQLEEIKRITDKIQAVCIANENLENEKDEYKELIQSPECVEIANKLTSIKKTKESIRAFLLKKGIHISPN